MPIIRYVKGDVFQVAKEPVVDAFAHGANCFNTMGAGVAAGVARFMPELYERDQKTRRGDVGKLGETSKVRFKYMDREKELLGINMYTQFLMGRNVDYKAIAKAFYDTNNHMIHSGLRTLVIPQIGCGIAGGEWKYVELIINNNTPDIDVIVVEYAANA